ncbi:hypothetical protein [Terricaulis sp.]|uniref:hypothetical protein n=1 Tax=Terricaulis sp. TaxID=2768686 RepID=UPI002AC76646|nr:hypothetical protein [Terricaulis sp.]MDZ4689705.1 hypothetical protein [Terricaulis sp.]
MSDDDTDGVTVTGAVRDLGWFSWLFALVVGGPSYLALLQEVFVDHRLLTVLGRIVDGYNRILLVIGGVFEPLLGGVIRAVSEWVNVSLVLQPHWKQLFVLGMIFVASYARTAWRGKQRVAAVLVGSALMVLALTCAAAASLSPLSSWLAHGWAAFSMTVLLTVVLAVTVTIRTKRSVGFAPPREGFVRIKNTSRTAYSLNVFALALPVVAFALGAFGAFIAQLHASAGIIAFNLVLLGTGITAVVMGVREQNRSSTRLGLTILGGFLAATLIIVADRLIALLQTP